MVDVLLQKDFRKRDIYAYEKGLCSQGTLSGREMK